MSRNQGLFHVQTIGFKKCMCGCTITFAAVVAYLLAVLQTKYNFGHCQYVTFVNFNSFFYSA